MLELRIERYLIQQAERRAGMAIKLGLNGWPDRLVLLPGALCGFAELKRPRGGVVSALQTHRLGELAKLGFITAVCASFTEVDTFLDRLEGRLLQDQAEAGAFARAMSESPLALQHAREAAMQHAIKRTSKK